jgi:hypothetical protein
MVCLQMLKACSLSLFRSSVDCVPQDSIVLFLVEIIDEIILCEMLIFLELSGLKESHPHHVSSIRLPVKWNGVDGLWV